MSQKKKTPTTSKASQTVTRRSSVFNISSQLKVSTESSVDEPIAKPIIFPRNQMLISLSLDHWHNQHQRVLSSSFLFLF